jgi:hypothetical protein
VVFLGQMMNKAYEIHNPSGSALSSGELAAARKQLGEMA